MQFYDSGISNPKVCNPAGLDHGVLIVGYGVENGTKNHTLVRKPRHCFGEDDWTTSAGTNSENSEWFVYETNNWSNLGFHTSNCSTSDKLAPWKEDFPRNSDWQNDWLLRASIANNWRA